MESYDVNSRLKEFQNNQKELASILKEAAEVTASLKMSKEKELANLSEKIQNDTFKIMVTGTFKNGKSTFINALLGEDILPAYAIPCTAVINEVKYGLEKKAILYFRDPLPDPLPENIASRAMNHIRKYNGKAVPPLEIPYSEIEDYVVISFGEDEKIVKMQSPYAKVELYYPLELLKNGVEIIDSPGLNEDETRTRVTLGYLPKVDAVLYVLNANAVCAGDEMKFVENDLRGSNFESVFFVVNRIDQIRERERPQISKYAEMKLKSYYSNPELFCISALDALDGRTQKDDTLVEKSGIISLEKRLTEFLTKEKGKAKLASPAKRARQILSSDALTVVIPRERKLLDSSLTEIREKYESIRPKLAQAEKEKNLKSSEMDTKIERSGRKFEKMAKRQIISLSNSVPIWVDEYTPSASFGVIPTKKSIALVANEIMDHLKTMISEEQQRWQTDELSPEIEEDTKLIFAAAEKDFSRIFQEIDDINIKLSGDDYQPQAVPFWQRVAGVAGGLVIGDVGLAISGGVNGIGKDLAKTAAFEFGAGLVLGLLGLLNPVTLVAVIVIAVFGNLASGSNKAMKQVKEKISAQAVEKITAGAEDQASSIADNIMHKLYEVKGQIVESVSQELRDLENQVKEAMAEKSRGEKDVDTRKKELKAQEEKIVALNNRLDTLVFKLLGE